MFWILRCKSSMRHSWDMFWIEANGAHYGLWCASPIASSAYSVRLFKPAPTSWVKKYMFCDCWTIVCNHLLILFARMILWIKLKRCFCCNRSSQPLIGAQARFCKTTFPFSKKTTNKAITWIDIVECGMWIFFPLLLLMYVIAPNIMLSSK